MARLAALSQGDTEAEQAFLWVDLGSAYLALGRVSDAVQAYAKAADCGAGAEAEIELAVLFGLRGEPLRAEAALQRIVARYPGNAAARVHLATLWLTEGRAAEVVELLKPAPPPGAGGVAWRAQKSFALLTLGRVASARAFVKRARPGEPPDILMTTQIMRLALHDGDTALVTRCADDLAAFADDAAHFRLGHRVEACFQLGGLYASVPFPEKAFRHWQKGHALLAAAQPFSRQHHGALLDATKMAFGAERFGNAQRKNTELSPMPVFIVGLPRSGTTLAEHILAAHAQIHGAGERLAVLETASRLGGNNLDPATPGRLASLPTETLSAEAARYLHGLRALAPANITRVVDKMPANDMQLGFIAALLPGARIIHCTRDTRATGYSVFRHYLSGYHPYAHDLADLGWYIRAQRGLMGHWREVLPVPVLDVALGDWIDDFADTLARVLTFLDLPHDPACEVFNLQDREVRTASRDQVRQPVNARSRDRWRTYEAQLAPMIAELHGIIV